jgi:hydroxymethylpyrimidine/phosphomethylpyrimidine kinase
MWCQAPEFDHTQDTPAKGLDLIAAVRKAKVYVSATIAAADRLTAGSGHGPVHHFHVRW